VVRVSLRTRRKDEYKDYDIWFRNKKPKKIEKEEDEFSNWDFLV
jgi:hypothetical protein